MSYIGYWKFTGIVDDLGLKPKELAKPAEENDRVLRMKNTESDSNLYEVSPFMGPGNGYVFLR